MMKKIILFAAIFTILVSFNTGATQPSNAEQHIKASLIYNFINFTRWPENSFNSESAPYTICIAGQDPYSKIFASVSNRTVHGRKLHVKRLQQPVLNETLRQCKILLNRLSDRSEIDRLLEKIINLPILTINESYHPKVPLVMINFVDNRGRIGFTINRTLAKSTGIEFSSRMLRLAVKVT